MWVITGCFCTCSCESCWKGKPVASTCCGSAGAVLWLHLKYSEVKGWSTGWQKMDTLLVTYFRIKKFLCVRSGYGWNKGVLWKVTPWGDLIINSLQGRQFMVGSHPQGNWALDKWMNLSKITHLKGSRFKTKEQSIFLFISLHVSKMKKKIKNINFKTINISNKLYLLTST